MTDSQSPLPPAGTQGYAGALPPASPGQLPVKPTRPWYKKKRFMIPILVVLVVGGIGSLGGGDEAELAGAVKPAVTEEAQSKEAAAATEAEAAAQAEEDAVEAAEKAAEDAAAAEVAAAAEAADAAAAAAAAAAEEAARGTISQQNARRSGESYLDFSAFSRTGLIEQLEYEGFSTEDATWGVDGVSVDWNEQAAKSAKSYLEFTSFSRSGLVEQLIYEGFTPEQAEYGTSQTGL